MSNQRLTADDVRSMLRAACETAGSQGDWAARHGVTQPYISHVLTGRREPPRAILKAMHLERVVEVYYRASPIHRGSRMSLDGRDKATLFMARHDTDAGGTWPAKAGEKGRARRLARAGLLNEAGGSAMGWTLYVITDAGRAARAALSPKRE